MQQVLLPTGVVILTIGLIIVDELLKRSGCLLKFIFGVLMLILGFTWLIG